MNQNTVISIIVAILAFAVLVNVVEKVLAAIPDWVWTLSLVLISLALFLGALALVLWLLSKFKD